MRLDREKPLNYTVKKDLQNLFANIVPQCRCVEKIPVEECRYEPGIRKEAGSPKEPGNGLRIKINYTALRYCHYFNNTKKISKIKKPPSYIKERGHPKNQLLKTVWDFIFRLPKELILPFGRDYMQYWFHESHRCSAGNPRMTIRRRRRCCTD